jgi:acylphosphatase
MKRCVRITVYGKVQGVGYREHIQKHAKQFRVEGSIQNADDGSVLIYASGAAEALDDLIDHIWQGSRSSKIEEVAIEIAPRARDFRGVFRVIGED